MIAVKQLLKKIFPIVYLKRTFLIYNRIKASTFDRLFFRPAEIPASYYKVNEAKNPFLELGIDLNLFDAQSRELLSLWTNPTWKQDQYLVHYKGMGFIEPKTGWGISNQHRLIYPSLGFSNASHVHKPSFIETYFRKKKVTRIKKVISLRDTGEENYFHFFNDVLPKIYFLESHGISLPDYTIIVSHALYQKPYFQFFIQADYFKMFNWHVQYLDEWISFDEAIFCKPFTHTRKFLDRSVQLCKPHQELNAPDRIFLSRSKQSLRFIENQEALLPILTQYKFEAIDTAMIPFEKQVQLFSQCRYLVAIHGAGLTNIIFRGGAPLSVLEIMHPFSYIPFHYVMLTSLYNYSYEVMVGKKGKEHGTGGFYLDPAEFKWKLESLLSL
jgi:hypothetical protein